MCATVMRLFFSAPTGTRDYQKYAAYVLNSIVIKLQQHNNKQSFNLLTIHGRLQLALGNGWFVNMRL